MEQDAALAWRGKDIGEHRFKGTADGQVSGDRRGEGGASSVWRDELEQEEEQSPEASTLCGARRMHQPEGQA